MSNCITMSVESKPKVGRPTLQEEVAIKSQLKFYFENGVGVEATASTTGRSTATVSKYFRIWSDELKEAMVKDFADEQHESKRRAIAGIDKQILQLYTIQEQINQRIQKMATNEDDKTVDYGRVPDSKMHFGIRDSLAHGIASLIDKRASIEMTMTVKDSLDKMVKEVMIKNNLVDDYYAKLGREETKELTDSG